jgi:diguanylate cyclase (GGDEF)-like protein
MHHIATSLESKELLQQTENIKRFLQRSKRWLWVLFALTLLTPILLFWVYYSVASSRLKQEFFNYVETIAVAAASQVDAQAHAQMISTSDPDGANSVERQAIRTRLVQMHRRLPKVHYLTTLIVKDDEGYIAIDTASELRVSRNGKPLQPSSYLEQYPAAPEDYDNYAAITRHEPYIFTKPYTDIFGTFVGACAPIEKVTGAYPTMVCVDVDAADYTEHLQTFKTRFLSASVLGAALCLLILYSLHQHQQQVSRSIALISQQRDLYLKGTNTDPLTGALNRRSMALMYEIAQAQCQRRNERFAVISVDVDHFKAVNDQFGHDCGDKVLINLVHTLNAHLRAGDVVARMGGEEFTVLCFPSTLTDAVVVAEKLRKEVARMQTEKPNGRSVRITISAGIYLVQPDDTQESAFKAADVALYQAKNQGRDCAVVYTG